MLYPASTILCREPLARARRLASDITESARGFLPVNVWYAQDRVTISAEVPGVEPEDIDISAKQNVLVFSGERKAVKTPDEAVWHQRERTFGKFSRALRIPFNVDPDKTEAEIRNGVLEIVVHRREEDKPHRITLKAA